MLRGSAPTPAIIGALAAANNLSDLGTLATALSNLGLSITGPSSPTLSDQSGATLTFTSVTTLSLQIGKLGIAAARFTFPSTANGSAALVQLLPSNSNNSGVLLQIGDIVTTAGTVLSAILGSNSKNFSIVTKSAGAGQTNANMSTALVIPTIPFITN